MSGRLTIPCFNITIKNQPYNAYTEDGQKINLYYYFRCKEHLNNYWEPTYYSTLIASDSNDTFYSLKFGPPNRNASGRFDVQVSARAASVTKSSIFVGQRSTWNTQTVTVPAELTNTSPTPTVPELSWLAIAPLLLSALFAAVFRRRRGVSKQQTNAA